MDFLLIIFAIVVFFIVWAIISRAVFVRFERSRGVASLFWFILWVGTLSFLFGGSGSGGNGYGNRDGEQGGGCEDELFDWGWGDSCSDYSDSSFSVFDDDD